MAGAPLPVAKLVIVASRMWDGRSDASNAPGWVAIAAGRISACGEGPVPKAYAGWPAVPLGEVTLLPGVVDAHVHLCLGAEPDPVSAMAREPAALTVLRAAARARRTLSAGVTTARDCGGRDWVDIALRDAIRGGEMPGPRLVVAGQAICITGGQGWPMGREADGIDDCRRAAREQLRAGADFIKLMATGGVLTPGSEPGTPQMDLEELSAAAAEARKAGRSSAAHAQGASGTRQAVLAGVRSIEHGVALPDEIIELMRQRDVYLVPTLSAPARILKAGTAAGIPAAIVDKTRRVTETHLDSFRRAVAGGVRIAMGTDAGTPHNEHGQNLEELRLMVDAGMRPADAWRAATSGGAGLLGLLDEIGTIESGKRADLIAVTGDALADLRDLPGRTVWVMQGGAIVKDQLVGGVGG